MVTARSCCGRQATVDKLCLVSIVWDDNCVTRGGFGRYRFEPMDKVALYTWLILNFVWIANL